MREPNSVRPVMLPPPGFVEQAVERGLAEVLAKEALRELVTDVPSADEAQNDIAPPRARKRRDSGIISGVSIDDTPTLPFIRVASASED
jgi:hypothetical protein